MATGGSTGTTRIITSTSSELRLRDATAFLHQSRLEQEVLVVAASRGAADDLARRAATARGASLGWHRFSVLQLAARLGVDALADPGPAARLAAWGRGRCLTCDLRRHCRRQPALLRAGRADARIPAGCRPHHRRTAAGGCCRRRGGGAAASRPRPGDSAGLHRSRAERRRRRRSDASAGLGHRGTPPADCRRRATGERAAACCWSIPCWRPKANWDSWRPWPRRPGTR